VSFRIDLHTHSYDSPDGGLTTDDYQNALKAKKLDYIAITDHDTIEAALQIKDRLGDLGERIIVGEEIATTDGEIIGLYLHSTIPEGMSPSQTVKAIHAQGGLVYIPHPFETVRSGISERSLKQIITEVDIIETHNGRAVFQNRAELAAKWAAEYGLAAAASSDAHGRHGWARTYTRIENVPERDTLAGILSSASYSKKTVGLGILYPKVNRIRNKRYAA
jgi:predicted metal-dependent phosphoesterase TrpH